jgi:hypothetical protein
MDLDMAVVMRPRYHRMPDPIETADDSDTSLPPAIRFVDFRGDFDTYFEINVIGPYPDTASRDRDLARLRRMPLGDPDLNGTAQFHADRIGTVTADRTIEPPQIAETATVRQFFAHWSGSTEADYYRGDDDGPADPYEPHPDQTALF